MYNDRQRNRSNRKSKRVILVAYEGKNKTEKNYFNSFQGIDKNYTIKVVPGNETDPVNLVKQTIQKSKELRLYLDDDDRAFCVFDTDTNPNKDIQIREACEIAKKNNITIITSSPCFELWFLLHYDYTTAPMDNSDVIRRLREFYPKYEKNCNLYPIIYKETKLACERALKLKQHHISDKKDIKSVNANPHSEVYQIIDEFNKKEM